MDAGPQAAQTPVTGHRTGVPRVHRRVFGDGTGAQPARTRLDAPAARIWDARRRRLRAGPGRHGLAARRPAARRAGRQAGQRVRVRGQEVLQQNDDQTLPEHRQ